MRDSYVTVAEADEYFKSMWKRRVASKPYSVSIGEIPADHEQVVHVKFNGVCDPNAAIIIADEEYGFIVQRVRNGVPPFDMSFAQNEDGSDKFELLHGTVELVPVNYKY